MGIVWTIVIGFIAGVLAKFIMPGSNEPSGFVLTTILGIVGAMVASFLGQALGWYAAGEGAGLIGAVVGAIVVLFVGDSSPRSACSRPEGTSGFREALWGTEHTRTEMPERRTSPPAQNGFDPLLPAIS